MSYEDAERELKQLVDDALAAGLDGKRPPSSPLTATSFCDDEFGQPLDEVTLSYEFEFPARELGGEPDGFILAVERVWQERGLQIVQREHDTDRFVVFAADDRGFNLKAFVNYGDKASVGGSGPCTEKPG